MMSLDFPTWSRHVQHTVEQYLAQHLPTTAHTPTRLHEAMRYTTLGGGKRVRPLLCFAAGHLVDASEDSLSAVAASIEAIHVYSLVHDDMPCMDDDVLRRGKPTCHVQYNEPTALLVGDALQSRAFEWLADAPLPAAQRINLVKQLAHAAGSQGMAGGQAIDLDSVGVALSLPELEMMHILKTGALIRAAIRMGAQCYPSQPLTDAQTVQLDRFAETIGLAFQVVDDILDVESDSTTLGKTAGKDADANKPTYVSLLGLTEAKAMASRLHLAAHEALADFGARAAPLLQLADYIVLRKH